jgi:hypothetical protein
MKQYRITSEQFVPQGESGDADAHMDPTDLAEIKKLAGILTLPGLTEGNVPNGDTGTGVMSPLGSNPSYTAQEKRALEKEHNIKPGTDAWFQLWFSKPYLTKESPIKGQ